MSTLLAGLIVLLSFKLQAVVSLSVSEKHESKLLTLPLTRVQQRTDIHPQIVSGLNFQYCRYPIEQIVLAFANAHQSQYSSVGKDDWCRAALCAQS